jgi:uncharacterized OB-fold protein
MATATASPFSGPGPSQVFADGLARGKFNIQLCSACGRHIFYPRALCHHCGSPALEWVAASGRGTVYATSVVRVRPEEGEHYNVALIDLEEGPRMMSRVIGAAPEDIKIGTPVIAFIGDLDGEKAVLFRPEK